MVPATDDGKSFGPKVVSKIFTTGEKGLTSWGKGLAGVEARFKNIFDLSKKIFDLTKKTADIQNKAGTKGAGNTNASAFPKLGMAEMPKKPGIVAGEPDGTGAGGLGGLGVSRGALLGLGVVAGVNALASMTPNTMTAVTQRMSADTTAGISGMSANSLIKQSNRLVGDGVTGLGSPTQSAMAIMYSGGFTASSMSSKNIMSSIGGMSALTGGSNEQMATALSQMNGMNFLRMGVQIRDSNGNLKPISTIVNSVWNYMYGSRKVTRDQVAMVYNPGSKAHQDVQTLSGGDSNLFAAIAQGLIARAGKGTGLDGADLSSAQGALNLLGVDKNAPVRANFKNNTANNNLLQATAPGLVSGYDAALNTNTTLTNGMTDLANAVPQVTDALMKLKGFLQTFPNTGPVGGGISGMVSSAVGFGSNMLMAKMMLGGGGGGLFGGGAGGLLGGGGGAAAAAGVEGPLMANGAFTTAAGAGEAGILAKLFSGGKSLLGKGLKGGLASIAGNLAGGAIAGNSAHGGARSRIGNAVKDASLWGGIASIFAPETFGLSTLLAGAAGGLYGAAMGGGGGVGNQPIGTAETSGNSATLGHPLAGEMVVTSGFGMRKDPMKKGKGSVKHHNGIDYACPVGTPVMAAAAGKVVTVKFDPNGYGNYVVIDHGEIKTVYGHLSKTFVHMGQLVSTGERIAASGATGAVTGPHLHFEVRTGPTTTSAKDPTPYLQGKKFFGKIFSGIKSVLSSTAHAVGSIFGLSKQSVKAPLLNSGAGQSISGMSSPALSSLLSTANASGAPISYDDIMQVTHGSTEMFKDTGINPSTGKPVTNVGVSNNKINIVSGDTGSMAFGGRTGLIKALYRDGFKTKKSLETAFAIALAESGGRSMAYNGNAKTGDDSYGLFQINMMNNDPNSPNMGNNRLKQLHLASNAALFNPETNVQAAYKISNKGTWFTPWSTYKSGAYVKYLDDAAKAGHLAGLPSYDVGTSRVPQDQLALVHKDEMIVPADTANKIRNGSRSGSASGVNINVDMKVSIANADAYQAEALFVEFKKKISHELRLKGMGTF